MRGFVMKPKTLFRYSKIQNIALSGITFIRYRQSQNIRKANNLNIKKKCLFTLISDIQDSMVTSLSTFSRELHVWNNTDCCR